MSGTVFIKWEGDTLPPLGLTKDYLLELMGIENPFTNEQLLQMSTYTDEIGTLAKAELVKRLRGY